MNVAALNLSAKPGGMDEQLVQLPPDTGAALLALTTVPKLGATVPAPQAMSSVPLTQDVHGEQAGLLTPYRATPPCYAGPLTALDPLPRCTPLLRHTSSRLARATPLTTLLRSYTPLPRCIRSSSSQATATPPPRPPSRSRRCPCRSSGHSAARLHWRASRVEFHMAPWQRRPTTCSWGAMVPRPAMPRLECLPRVHPFTQASEHTHTHTYIYIYISPPKASALSFLLRLGSAGLGCPVEIEFALKLRQDSAIHMLHPLTTQHPPLPRYAPLP